MVDQMVTFTGTVTQAFSPDTHAMVILDFDKNYRTTLTALIKPENYSKFPDLQTLVGKQLLVTGKSGNYHGRSHVEVTDSSQIKIL
jgi:DNA/RNA endonuclease YhcR with UshA esterase domain